MLVKKLGGESPSRKLFGGCRPVSTITDFGFQTGNMVMNSKTDSFVNVSVLEHLMAQNHFRTCPLYLLISILHEVRNKPTGQ